jgi:hypothetical protein
MILRAGLLEGRRIALCGADDGGAIEAQLRGLGAWLQSVPGPEGVPSAEGIPDEEACQAWVGEHQPLHALVADVRSAFASGAGEGVRRALEAAWIPARAAAAGSFIPGGEGGRLIFVAPPAEAGPLAEAARAGLENLSRTLSVEWARHGITAVSVCPGEGAESELATVIAYLLSPAGGYLTGCRLDVAGAAAAS